MEKQQLVVVCRLYKEEGYWYYNIGSKFGTETSSRQMTHTMARKGLDQKIAQAKNQYGKEWDVQIKELAS